MTISPFFFVLTVEGINAMVGYQKEVENTAVIMCKWIELYIRKRRLKLRLHAFSHIVGSDVPNNNDWLSEQLAARSP